MEQRFTSTGLDDLQEVAKKLADSFQTSVVAFTGNLGAGKTTLIKALCKEFGVQESVSSPTFSLVNEYHSPARSTIYHFDWYRLEEEEEALDMGLEDYLNSGNLCLMEWPEKIRNLIPEQLDWVNIDVRKGERLITHKIINQ